jgi:hypothetical protein
MPLAPIYYKTNSLQTQPVTTEVNAEMLLLFVVQDNAQRGTIEDVGNIVTGNITFVDTGYHVLA